MDVYGTGFFTSGLLWLPSTCGKRSGVWMIANINLYSMYILSKEDVLLRHRRGKGGTNSSMEKTH